MIARYLRFIIRIIEKWCKGMLNNSIKGFLNILNNKKIDNPEFHFKNSRISFNSPIPKFTELKVGEWTSCSAPLTVHAYHTSSLKLNINKFVHIGKNFKWIASKEHTPRKRIGYRRWNGNNT